MNNGARADGARLPRRWERTAVRLPVLLALLAVVAYYGVPRILHNASANTMGRCPTAPSAAKLPLGTFRATLARSGIELLVGEGTADLQGWQEPAAAWTDVPPPPAGLPSNGVVDAGYELRWWSPAQDHQGVSMFVFDAPAVAAGFVRQAASPRCRDSAASYRLAEPIGARAVVWTNPVHVRQADVFFARGARVYRVAEVPPDSYERGLAILTAGELLGISQQLACQLREAGCGSRRHSPTLTWGGWLALQSLAGATARLGRSPGSDALPRFSHDCLRPVVDGDAESQEIETGCKAVVSYLRDYAAGVHCARTRDLACESANIAAVAGDLERASAVGRELARNLSAGACRILMAGSAFLDDRQAQALLLYTRGLAGRDENLTEQARRQMRALEEMVRRQTLRSWTHLGACSPSSSQARLKVPL